jgi:MoaA/NifB/PqqE/SkfB family radical SAM enzyme
LEHHEIDKIIEIVNYFHRVNKMDFGILTNGQNITKLNPNTIKIALQCFAYIRLSFSEMAFENPKLRDEYLNNLSILLDYKKENKKFKAIIGSKILLTRSNKFELLEIVDELIEMGVEHLKVKSIRSQEDEPSHAEVMEFEEMLNSYQKSGHTEVLKVDLRKTEFPDDFNCWINPIITTIDPQGRIYICYNFHNDQNKMMIGEYNENNSLSDFWGTPCHLDKIRAININRVCKADSACNCRFVDYQKMIEENTGKYLNSKSAFKKEKDKYSSNSDGLNHFL